MVAEISGNKNGHICVFNCIDTPRGCVIAREMLAWLEPLYEVHTIYHDGRRFEHVGIAYLQYVTQREPLGNACLYLHTKGACHNRLSSYFVRALWKREFGDPARASDYFEVVTNTRTPVVACPFTDSTKITRYNGFVVNDAAMNELSLLSERDRLWYENMWQDHLDTDIRAMKYWGGIRMIHWVLVLEYLYHALIEVAVKLKLKTYKSKSYG